VLAHAVSEEQPAARRLVPPRRGERLEIAPGAHRERGRGEPPRPLLPGEEPALVVAADRVDARILEERERPLDVAVPIDEIPGHEHPIHRTRGEEFEGAFEPSIFAVDVSDQAHAAHRGMGRGHGPIVPARPAAVDADEEEKGSQFGLVGRGFRASFALVSAPLPARFRLPPGRSAAMLSGMALGGLHDLEKIAPTAEFTAAVWAELGLENAEHFVTPRGARLLRAYSRAAEPLLRRVGDGPSLVEYLEYRHRAIDQELEAIGPDRILECAAGLSRRGLTFAKRGVPVLELDLPHMVEA